MSTRILRSALALFFTAALVTAAFGWDDTGHELSAYIAWKSMSPEARARAAAILLKAPEDSDLSVPYNAFNSRSKAIKELELFMFAATWPDVVRNRDFEVRYKKYHHSNWHYSDIFWKGDGEIIKDFPEPSGMAVPKLEDFERILRDPTATDADKAIALAWFLHVAADLHNPLHNASRVTDTEPKGDQGGNLFYLEPAKQDGSWRLNLHSFWDSIFTKTVPRVNDACDADYIRPMGDMVTNLYPLSELSGELELSDYAAWNREGFAFLPETVYGSGLKRDTAAPPAYARQAFRVSERQIALAGYRIAATLNSAFGSGPNAGMASEGCKVIRRVPYPVRQKTSAKQEPTVALLDICPPKRGMVARPTIVLDPSKGPVAYEYDIIVVFDSEASARSYAAANHIEDVKFN